MKDSVMTYKTGRQMEELFGFENGIVFPLYFDQLLNTVLKYLDFL